MEEQEDHLTETFNIYEEENAVAYVEFEFESKTLKRLVSFRAVLPGERFRPPYPTLYLLHGLGGNSARWLHYTRLRWQTESRGLAVILPSGENSFYLDIPVKDGCLGDFGEYVGRELVAFTRKMLPLSRRREDTYIGGMSMGGYGALRNGLKYHDTFGKIAVFAGAVHFYEYPRDWVRTKGNVAGELMNFADLDVTQDTDRNPRVLIGQIEAMNRADGGQHFPEVYMTCGEEDSLLGANRALAEALEKAGATVVWKPRPGRHDFAFCDAALPEALDWLDPCCETEKT